MEVFARRFAVFIELSGSKINGANARNDSAFAHTFRTEMIANLKHHSRLDSFFELRQVLDRRNIRLFRFWSNRRLFGCDLSNRLRLYGFRLFFFGFSSSDILIKTAAQELIIRDILLNLKSSASAFDSAIISIIRQCTCQCNNFRNHASSLVAKSVTDFHLIRRCVFLRRAFRFHSLPLCLLFRGEIGIASQL